MPFGFGTILMAVVNIAILELVFHQIYPPGTWDYIQVCVHPIVAAIQEPITSKLLPAVFITLLAIRRGWIADVRDRALKLGILGGLTVGLVEAGSKMLDKMALNIETLPPVLMHTITGGVLATVVFRFGGKEDNQWTASIFLGAYLAAVIVHWLWNTRIVFWIAGGNPC